MINKKLITRGNYMKARRNKLTINLKLIYIKKDYDGGVEVKRK